jgi:hypothetical protein
MQKRNLKYLLVVVLLVFFQAGYGQDTLLLRDGQVYLVANPEPDTVARMLHCDKGGERIAVPFHELSRFSMGESWFVVNPLGAISGPVTGSGFKLGANILQRPVNGKPNKFSIGTNVVAPFVDTWEIDYDYSSSGYSTGSYFTWDIETQEKMRMTFASNRTFSIEPQVQLSAKWALKIPVIIGFRPKTEEHIIQSEDLWGQVSDYDNRAAIMSPFARYHLPEFDLIGVVPVDVITSGDNYYTGYFMNRRHGKNLLFQVGLAPRFYPFGQTKNAVYFSPSLNVGLADHHALDVYASFDTTTYQYSNYWILTQEEITVKRSPFIYFRGEASAGMEFVSKAGFFLSMEGGVSSTIKNRGEADRYFIKQLDGEYVLQHSDVFDFGNDGRLRWSLYPVARVHVGFKFGNWNTTRKN